MLLGVLVLYGFFQALAYREANLGALLPPDQVAAAQANLTAYWGAPAHTALLGAVERLLALCIQLGLSILVLQSLARRNLLWLGLAVGWHALVDGAALVSLAAWGPWGAEGVLALLALISLGTIFGLRGRKALERSADLTPAPGPHATDSHPPVLQVNSLTASATPQAADSWTHDPKRLAETRFLEN
jgi:uncharacterized membrane protein YhfC